MAKNDVILLDGIIDERVADSSVTHDRDEVFELFVLEQVLKDYDLSADEIEAGWTDGAGDGGIDGFYIFINGHLLDDPEEFIWPRTHAAIDVWLITCKHHATFLQAPLDAIIATIQELFDLSVDATQFHGTYSDELLELRSFFEHAYRRLSIGRPQLRFTAVYASRGDSTQLGASVIARARQIEAAIVNLFSSCVAGFQFFGASELVTSHRRTKTFSLNLPFVEHLATGWDSYVLLVKRDDYWRFVTDESGNLRRYLFDSNVRDFLGPSGVNDDIARSLKDPTTPDLWWLNNGVTILATAATVPGKTIQLQDIQIVNGLQTTETIFRHFSSGAVESVDRCLLVKIIVSSDARARDQIIRATNNQNPVEVAALRATDKVQRDIEAMLERHNWCYERRRNYYRNIGKPEARLVTPIYLASAVVSLVFRNPRAATRLKTKFMRNQESYDSVFSPDLPLDVWPVLAAVYKYVDRGLVQLQSTQKRRDRFLSNWRPVVSLLLGARGLGKFSYSMQELAALDVNCFGADGVFHIWDVITDVRRSWDLKQEVKHPKNLKQSFFMACCEELARRYELVGLEQVGKRSIAKPRSSGGEAPAKEKLPVITPEFVDPVNAALPTQPWKQGIHRQAASQLNCHPQMVTAAIQKLIADGLRYQQHNGVVYDRNGQVLMIDEERVKRTDAPNFSSGTRPPA